jgi:hypothetical protein
MAMFTNEIVGPWRGAFIIVIHHQTLEAPRDCKVLSAHAILHQLKIYSSCNFNPSR